MKVKTSLLWVLSTKLQLKKFNFFFALIEIGLFLVFIVQFLHFFVTKKKKTWMMEDNIEEASAGIKSPVQLI